MIKYKEYNENNVSMSSPWVEYYHDVEEIFGADPSIHLYFDEDNYQINIQVDGQEKYEALTELLPTEKIFGNIILRINIVPSNKKVEKSIAQIFDAVFDGNPNYSFTKVISSPFMSNPMTFVVFKKKVVQYFNDNIGDLYGNKSTLHENLARELFDRNGVFFCTDVKDED